MRIQSISSNRFAPSQGWLRSARSSFRRARSLVGKGPLIGSPAHACVDARWPSPQSNRDAKEPSLRLSSLSRSLLTKHNCASPDAEDSDRPAPSRGFHPHIRNNPRGQDRRPTVRWGVAPALPRRGDAIHSRIKDQLAPPIPQQVDGRRRKRAWGNNRLAGCRIASADRGRGSDRRVGRNARSG